MTGAPQENVYSRFAQSLGQTEWLPRPQLNAYRDGLLARLATFAYAQSPFYRERLKPLFRQGGDPDLRAWREIPILRRADVESEIDRINPTQLPSELGAIETRRTSGTTGGRLSLRTCALAQIAERCILHRLYHWRNFNFALPMASIRFYFAQDRAYPEGKTEAGWSFPAPETPHYMLDWRTSVSNTIEWLVRKRPSYLLTFPSLAHELAQHPDAARVADLNLRGIVAISEAVMTDARTAVRAAFGCEIAQVYACVEVGTVAVQSPVDEHLLLAEEAVFAEILDDAGELVGPGETGRVVLTGLYNYATPFIRYEIGDYATRAEDPCPSGRTLGRLRRIEGRARNALVTAAGRKIWRSDIPAADILRHVAARQFQICQPNAETIVLAYVPRTAAAASENLGLAAYFTHRLGRPILLRLEPVQEIARSAGGKYEHIVSMVA